MACRSELMADRGLLEDGTLFDASAHDPIRFEIGVGKVIRGMDEALLEMSVGERATLMIPPEYGYGEAGVANTIPPKATLYFEVELLSIERPQPAEEPIQGEAGSV
ncbi:uncharacterized protein BJ171DRAFT_236765 [Polychytrium aggregatum]|uniref:uncharacterized protein n=1 Tax=Polychytrium aggregatum TaxID=110093 RepID=UPI0022FF0F64|nr:uncharacterized protein BJ171DRAFT_236765 [Polychytrium aggregatum]KAI9208237.1 hypothetical protein BJ171DRAFT_236765 [Polychytrium aggregatum]